MKNSDDPVSGGLRRQTWDTPHRQIWSGKDGMVKRLRWFGIVVILVALAEFVLCFTGPIAFIRKPSLVLFPPFPSALDGEEEARVSAFLEREIALTNSYAIMSFSFIVNSFIRGDPAFDEMSLVPADGDQAREIARELDFERYGTVDIYRGEGWCRMYVWLRDTRTGEVTRYGSFASDSLENLLEKRGLEDTPLNIQEKLSVETRGLGFTNGIVLALIILQILLGMIAFSGKDPGVLAEIVPAGVLILFIFAFIYAKSAGMDYVQRYIAMRGQLHLAESTAMEQLKAVLRFGPMLLVTGALYFWRNLWGFPGHESHEIRQHGGSPIDRYVKAWALP